MDVTDYTLGPQDAAEYLTALGLPCHRDTLKRWVRAGRVRALQTPGGWWKFSTADLDAFAADRIREPSEAAS